MADLFAGPILEKIIETGFEYLKDQVRWQTGMKDELQRLRNIQPKIQAVVDCASSQPQIRDHYPALNDWLWQLRDAIDEADDVFDELEYMNLEQRLTTNIEETKKPRKVRSIMKSVKKKVGKVVKRALRIDPNLKRLEEAVKKLDQVSADVHTFLHLLDSAKQEVEKHQLESYKTRETGALPKNDLISRVKEKEYVMQWLRKPSNVEHHTAFYSNISLLSIVGHGGMGKTTLFADEMTKEFDIKIWVCVSNNFDAKRVIADMLESLKKERPRLESLHTLQESLKSEVTSKKFLLVLDDIWEEEEKSKWGDVLAPLASGCLGSKILVTTRSGNVALIMAKEINKKNEVYTLEGLKEGACLQLLNSHAFADVENPNDHKKLRFIAEKIAKKLSGSPLAAKVIGGVLSSSLDEKHWSIVLNSDIGSAGMGQNNILSILRLSYTFLPQHLQKYFAFCSIFEQDHRFRKKDLVRMWIALGFIETPSNSEETMEDIGGRYFDILVKKSLFEKSYGQYYKMHDLLHELAQSVSAQECIRVASNDDLPSKIPKTIRHLRVQTSNLEVLKKMEEIKKLRSLFLICEYINDEQGLFDELAEVFKASRNIRLLYIHSPGLKMIPEEIKYLIHLRYLKVDDGHNQLIDRLPRSLGNLYHLQFIIYKPTSSPSTFLPRDINNLSNLRYLSSNLHWNEIPGPVGKLNSLQELEFDVKDAVGYRIGGLEHMNELHKLKIKHLENVKAASEACSAKLSDKKKLSRLSLEWGGIDDQRNVEELLDILQPHKNLKKLMIEAYMGVRSARWINNSNLMSNLEYIRLDECLEWETLPDFGQLPFLKSLYLHQMPKVKKLENKFYGSDEDCAFPSLEVLHIEKLEALEDWFDATAAVDDRLFPCLRKIYLKDCPNMRELPSFPPKLETLEIHNIGWKALNGKQGTSSCRNMSKSIPLEILTINRCPNITYIPLADEQTRLAALRYVEILHCPNLISLGGHQGVETAENCLFRLNRLSINDPSVLLMEPLRSITSLEGMTIKENDELVSFPAETERWFMQISSSLRQLWFLNLNSLQSLPSYLTSLSSLELLYVHQIPHIQQLPNIPASLKRLILSSLESLQCLPSSMSTISSLEFLSLDSIPLIKSLPDLPPSLHAIEIHSLENLDSLPSCLLNLSSLKTIRLRGNSALRKLPDLPPSLVDLTLSTCGNPEFIKRYTKDSGSDWHKIAHIPNIDTTRMHA